MSRPTGPAPGPAATSAEVSLAEVLTAREERARRQAALLGIKGTGSAPRSNDHPPAGCVLSVTLVVPGPVKTPPWALAVFDEALTVAEGVCADRGWPVPTREVRRELRTGPEALWLVAAPAAALKAALVAVEGHHPLGRLWDLDVVTEHDGLPRPLTRHELDAPTRPCLVCGGPVQRCARSRAHPVTQILSRTRDLVAGWQRSRATPYARLAEECLLAEVRHTPKPGLVDLRNTGAHTDMDVPLFEASAAAILPALSDCERIGAAQGASGRPLPEALALLRAAGRHGEELMADATNGVNTHRGAIFAFGLLCAGAGWLSSTRGRVDVDELCRVVAATAAPTLADLDGPDVSTAVAARARSGLTGARGEAAGGYATVREAALPAYREVSAATGRADLAAGQALLQLLAVTRDTNVVSRGGSAAGRAVRRRAEELLADGGAAAEGFVARMCEWDDELIAQRLSPGGVADLLGVTLFLSRVAAVDLDGCGYRCAGRAPAVLGTSSGG